MFILKQVFQFWNTDYEEVLAAYNELLAAVKSSNSILESVIPHSNFQTFGTAVTPKRTTTTTTEPIRGSATSSETIMEDSVVSDRDAPVICVICEAFGEVGQTHCKNCGYVKPNIPNYAL